MLYLNISSYNYYRGIRMNIIKKNRRFIIFLMIEVLFCGFIAIFILTNSSNITWKQIWPIFAIVSGLSLFITGLIISKRLSPSFFVPALALVLFGVFFFLFSMRIVTIPLKQFLFKWWYIFFVLGICIIIFIFLYRRSVSKRKEDSGE